MERLSLAAPAKINTVLRVLGRRSDGYHDLSMVMVKLTLTDEIVLEPIARGIELVCDGSVDDGMRCEKNLASRAAALLKEKTGISSGVRITVTKRIPVAAGLGGGSSDAAAVLSGLNRLWQCDLAMTALAEIGVSLGADVPFFCYDTAAAFVEGIGERVTPLASFPKLFLLLINPGFPLSTREVYEAWDRQVSSPPSMGGDKGEGGLHNDLEPIALRLRPAIGEVKQWLQSHGATGVLMSGSGPTVFGIFSDVTMRDRALQSAKPSLWKAFATMTM